MKKVNYLFKTILIVTISLFIACSGEDGTDGIDGVAGTDGAMGVAGIDGTDGANGVDGVDGQDGDDGEDGNADVRHYITNYDATEIVSSNLNIDINITEDEYNNATSLVFYTSSGFKYAAPGGGFSNDYYTRVYSNIVGTFARFYINFIDTTLNVDYTLSAGEITSVEIIIIPYTSSATLAKGVSKRDQILKNLENEGIDVNNYDEVAAYYNL